MIRESRRRFDTDQQCYERKVAMNTVLLDVLSSILRSVRLHKCAQSYAHPFLDQHPVVSVSPSSFGVLHHLTIQSYIFNL